ncbi:Aste57867_17093 [Aphanomyces stellatus]|uniref:Aste57867_17093 protein n=1 Tax=Aphanomyces stellatus TaxID=120398 RepID=A0A485L7W7_9STRA|nr:hypothetical protein As57867_017034 [Aphanomyces stellatus]VFT93851.1 Aste57867_17093 [Aphanomyces stellatus]
MVASLCGHCGQAPASKRCTLCGLTIYCDRACQRNHWQRHKRACRDLRRNPQSDVGRKTTTTTLPLPTESDDDADDTQEYAIPTLHPNVFLAASTSTLNNIDTLRTLLIDHVSAPPPTRLSHATTRTYTEWMRRRDEFLRRFRDMPRTTCETLLQAYDARVGQFAAEEATLITPNTMLRTVDAVIARLGSHGAIAWLDTAPLHHIRDFDDGPAEDSKTHRSFSNTPSPTQRMWDFLNQTRDNNHHVHVAVGYVDLSMLLDVDLCHGPNVVVRWVGYEGSVFCVAKALVMRQMLLHNASVDSILQVWYSAAWLRRTLDDFAAAVRGVLSGLSSPAFSTVALLLRHWQDQSPTLAVARRTWLAKTTAAALDPIANSIEARHRAYLTDYFLTGELLDASVGSVTLCCLPPMFESTSHTNESALASIDATQLLAAAVASNGDVVAAFVRLRRRHIGLLQRHLLAGHVVIDIRPPAQPLVSSPSWLLDELAAHLPTTMSWGNAIDRMSPKALHELAQRCGAIRTLHGGWSVRWPQWTQGASYVDVAAGEPQAVLLASVRGAFAGMRHRLAAQVIMRSPPVLRPSDCVDYGLCCVAKGQWATSFVTSGVDAIVHYSDLVPLNSFAPGLQTVNVTWSYK